jgi:rubredoxin---NAD+ reductase
MQKANVVIIGSGLAGYNLAKEIRKIDQNLSLIMISQDKGDFYSKPQLSTALRMKKTASDLIMSSAEKMSEDLAMTIKTNCKVDAINSGENQITLQNGDIITYDQLVLALGADTPTPPLSGDGIDALYHVNDVYQYQAFREAIENKKHITIIGAGLVGCEFANDLSMLGFTVSMVDPAPSALSQLVPKEIGGKLQSALTAQGVNWHLGNVVKTINKSQDKLTITLDNDETWETDVVLSAVGLRPRIDLAKTADIQCDRGINVDKQLKTNVDNVYALGDCAQINGWNLHYVGPILHAAKCLAKTLTGETNELTLPALPVVIKTSCYPICLCCPPFSTTATWSCETDHASLKFSLKNKQDELLGFMLTKNAVKERMAFMQQLPAWL